VGFLHILLVFEANPFGAHLQTAATSGATQTCPGASGSLSELLELGVSTSEEDMVRGYKRGARWEGIVNMAVSKRVDFGRAWATSTLIWPRGKLGGATWASCSIKLARARWPGPSPELVNEDHCLQSKVMALFSPI
jgi:hypothetical protein